MAQEDNDDAGQSGADYAQEQASDMIGGVVDGTVDAFNPFDDSSDSDDSDDDDGFNVGG